MVTDHDNDSAIFVHLRYYFQTRAGSIHIGSRVRGENDGRWNMPPNKGAEAVENTGCLPT